MKNRKYTTVKEMTDKVNEVLELIEKAKELTRELVSENVRNEFQLRYAPDSPEVKGEWRPINLEQRIKEAQKYQKVFDSLCGQLVRAEATIARGY